jgi:hypothetical protein
MFSIDDAHGFYWEQNRVHPWLDNVTCSDLIDLISQTCPNIEKLSILPTDSGSLSVLALRELRSVTSGGHNVDKRLIQDLGRLPRLESLSLVSDWSREWPVNGDPITVSDDSFPSLQNLVLYGLDQFTVSRICDVRPLFRHLVRVNIIYEDANTAGAWSDRKRSQVSAECLGQNTPCLTDLTILPRGNKGNFVFSWAIIEAFR